MPTLSCILKEKASVATWCHP